MRKVWKLWAKALGQKASKNNKEADNVAFVRTIILFTYLITNAFIIAGVIRHWNDINYIKSDQICQIKNNESIS